MIQQKKHYYFFHGNNIENLQLRDEDSIAEDVEYITSAPNVTQANKRGTERGISGKSQLLRLKSMKLPRSLPIDGMHHLFLNLAPTFIGLFDLDENYCTEVHTILENAITPSFINRGIKSLSDRNYWKAEQWKDFVIYYSVPLITTISGQRSKINFWKRVTVAFEKIIRREIEFADLGPLEEELKWIVKEYEKITGATEENPSPCKLMIHALLHVVRCLIDCGPAFTFWQFPTERLLGILGNFIHSKKNPGVNLKKNLQVLQDYFLLKASIPSLFDSIMEEAEEIEIQVALEVHAILNDPLPNEHEKLLADLLDVEDVNGSYINDFELDGFKFIPENRTRANAEKINSWGLFEHDDEFFIGNILYLYKLEAGDIYAFVHWLPKPNVLLDRYYVCQEGPGESDSFISVVTLKAPVLILKIRNKFYAIPKLNKSS